MPTLIKKPERLLHLMNFPLPIREEVLWLR